VNAAASELDSLIGVHQTRSVEFARLEVLPYVFVGSAGNGGCFRASQLRRCLKVRVSDRVFELDSCVRNSGDLILRCVDLELFDQGG
jgi:hypothetical protein